MYDKTQKTCQGNTKTHLGRAIGESRKKETNSTFVLSIIVDLTSPYHPHSCKLLLLCPTITMVFLAYNFMKQNLTTVQH
jgi:hypothetical protein